MIGLVFYGGSPRTTDVGYSPEQPVPYSHALHVGELGLDCRYCHVSVERAASAGMPPTATCMNCHKLIWNDSPMLEPVRRSWATGEPLRWNRVHDLPDYVYFDHSIHIAKGVGCVSCHGRVDEMPLLRQASSLQMGWCLECHREPQRFVRPREEIFNLAWEAEDQATEGAELVLEYNIEPSTSCSRCHR